jgi:hypothetical protein
MCPGRRMATETIWSTIAALLSLYDIGCALDEGGKVILPKVEFTSGLLR